MPVVGSGIADDYVTLVGGSTHPHAGLTSAPVDALPVSPVRLVTNKMRENPRTGHRRPQRVTSKSLAELVKHADTKALNCGSPRPPAQYAQNTPKSRRAQRLTTVTEA